MLVNYDVEARRKSKMKSDDRVIVLKVMDDKKPVSSTGNVDTRLFNGDNHLHAFYDDMKGMWRMHYEQGAIPQALQQHFTTFEELIAHTKSYFNKRNIDIVDIKE